jgi:hypothetical protein
VNDRSIILALLVTLLCTISEPALAAENIVLRTNVTPENPLVGQKVLLQIDVLAKDGWAQLKKIGDAEIDGLYVVRLESQGTRLNEVIDGSTYTGQRYEFMLFAQREGNFTILPVPVDVEVKSWGVGRNDQIHRLSLPVVEFRARTPPGAEGIRGLISTSDLVANQAWEPKTDEPVVGDAIKRTITLNAPDVSGMAFAPIEYPEIPDLGIYPGEPAVEDKFDRGNFVGTRTETVTYVFERPGEIEIPAVTFSWWNVDSMTLQHVELPGLSLRVATNISLESENAGGTASQTGGRLLWSVLIALLAAAVIVLRFGRRISARFAAWRKARSETEAVYFRSVLRSARSGDQTAVLRDTMRWLDRINHVSRPARLDQFLRDYGGTGAQAASLELMKTHAPDQAQLNIVEFVNGLTAARKCWRRARSVQQKAKGLIPELNSTG